MSYPYPFQTQYDSAGSGRNDCFEASLGAYLRALGKIPASTSDADALNQISLACRGTPDQPGNPDTTLAQADIGLAHYGLPVELTYDYTKALNAPWSINLIDGTGVLLADGSRPYPVDFFGGSTGPNHFSTWGPGYQGSYGWIMNPLALVRAWAIYDLGSWQRSWTCAYLLGDIPAKPAPKPLHWTAKTKATLKPVANHSSTGITTVPAKGTGNTWGEEKTVAGELWRRVQFTDKYGWLLDSNLTIAAA